MTKEQALNLIIQVVLNRATGTSVEIDSWKNALVVLQNVITPKPEESEKVVEKK